MLKEVRAYCADFFVPPLLSFSAGKKPPAQPRNIKNHPFPETPTFFQKQKRLAWRGFMIYKIELREDIQNA